MGVKIMNETFIYGQHGNKIITVRRDYPQHDEKSVRSFVEFAKELAKKGILDLQEVSTEVALVLCQTSDESATKLTEKIDTAADKVVRKLK